MTARPDNDFALDERKLAALAERARAKRLRQMFASGQFLERTMSRAPMGVRIGWQTGPREPSGCRLWLGRLDPHGYGYISTNNQRTTVGRAILGLQRGNPMDACHHCDNPPCVEPTHLYAGTRKENVRDMIVRGRSRAVGLWGEDNPSSVLTAAQVLEIRRRSAAGEGRAELALEFRTTRFNIAHIRANESWAWLKEES